MNFPSIKNSQPLFSKSGDCLKLSVSFTEAIIFRQLLSHDPQKLLPHVELINGNYKDVIRKFDYVQRELACARLKP